MPDVAKLKKKAAEFELKKQFDKALAAYVEILDSYGRHSAEEVDLALYNRVGDLFLKQGNVAEAVDYYEQAVDRYAEGGFFNNAIALCNKILRNSPGRASVYYKLGKISAHKGFKSDAKANFLEYADRMQQSGKIDEAFRALKEFADLCPDQDDIRLMLADQLSRKGRGPEAVEQLQTLYERYTQEGRDTEARATVERMKAIDPSSEPRTGGKAPRAAAGDLVFLDLDDTSPAVAPAPVVPPPPPVRVPAPAPPAPTPPPAAAEAARRATQGLDIIATGEAPELDDVVPPPPARPRPTASAPVQPQAPDPELVVEPDLAPPDEPGAVELDMYEPEVLDGMNRTVDFERVDEPASSAGLLEGLEMTSFGTPQPDMGASLLDLEPTSFAPPPPPPAPPVRPAPRPAAPPVAPPVAPPAASIVDDLLDFDMPDQRQDGPREVAPREVLRAPTAPSVPARPSLHDLPLLEDVPADEGAGSHLELIMPEDDVDDRDVAAARLRTPPALDEIPLMDLDLPVPGEAMAHVTGAPAGVPDADDLQMIDLGDSGFASPAFDLAPAEELPAEELPSDGGQELDFLSLDSPADALAPVELSPAELDVRADLDLDVAPLSRADSIDFAPPDVSGDFTAVPAREPTGEFDTVPDAPADSVVFDDIPAPARRSSTMLAAQSVEMLRALLDGEPDDLQLRRRLGEALLESGDREGGMRELETAMVGFERNDDLASAASLADEIVLLNPSSVRHHQKRVEYAFRTNERGRLIEAYLQLADALFRAGQMEKSRAIYQRVLDLAPDELRANAALQSFPEEEVAPASAPAPKPRATTAVPRAAAPLKPIVTSDDEFVNLGDWLRDDEAPKDTRMIVEEKEPTGDEEADFQDMLRKFKQGIAENVEEEDHQSHYDLGVAYKEMGLLDEAIAEFQKALRGPVNRVPTYEALGQCFIEKEQYPMAATILGRALQEKGVSDDQLVGVLYLLGQAAEARGQREEAAQYYQRVFVVDIQFRDIGDRLAAVEGAS